MAGDRGSKTPRYTPVHVRPKVAIPNQALNRLLSIPKCGLARSAQLLVFVDKSTRVSEQYRAHPNEALPTGFLMDQSSLQPVSDFLSPHRGVTYTFHFNRKSAAAGLRDSYAGTWQKWLRLAQGWRPLRPAAMGTAEVRRKSRLLERDDVYFPIQN